jgi:hypothetical protein
MNKQLEELLERVAHWPEGAQEDAAVALKDIEERLAWERKLSPEDQSKLAVLREMVRNSIAEGGDNSPDDVDAMIDEMAARSVQAR